MKAVDEYVPTPERDVDKPFLMPVEDVLITACNDRQSRERTLKLSDRER